MCSQPAESTRLTLVRHAHVSTGLLCGSLDLPLSRIGRRQLEELPLFLPNPRGPHALYSSGLTRAMSTAAALAKWCGLQVQVEPLIGEIHCGMVEGMSLDALPLKHPEIWRQNLAQNDDDFAWPGGESYRQFRERALLGLNRIVARHHGQHVAVVTHTGVITQMVGIVSGRRAAVWDHHRAPPLSATEIDWFDHGPRSLVSFDRKPWW